MTSGLRDRTTEETFLHHAQALGGADVDEVLIDYAEDAVIFTPDGTLHGHDEFRSFFERTVTEVMPPGTAFEMLTQAIEGEIVYIVWSAESVNYRMPLGTDTFVIREGQIVRHTFAAVMEPK